MLKSKDFNRAGLRFPPSNSPGEGMTAGLAKGVCMFDGPVDLSEEGMGFGVPVVVSRWRTYLSYQAPVVETSADGSIIKKVFHMDAVQNIGEQRQESVLPYLWVEVKGLVYKSLPWAQRWMLARRTTGNLTPKIGFKTNPSLAKVPVEYMFTGDGVRITVDLEELNALPDSPRIYVVNEQGGCRFPAYREDPDAPLTECDSGWTKVSALSAGFSYLDGSRWFSLNAQPGAIMFRGREVVDDTLSWSGIEYFITNHPSRRFSYQIDVGETTDKFGGYAK